MIRVDNVSFSYGRQMVISGLSFEAEPGECVVLAGPNGSGKTTALSVIAGILKPSSGTASVEGRVGYVPQGSALFEDATVGENLRFFAGLSHSRVPETLPFSVGKYLGKRVSKLSGGMKKQVSIACAMTGDPKVILLDEPCAALDISFRDDMIALIEKWKSERRTVVYVGHDPAEFFPVFDKIVFLDASPVVFARRDLPEISGDEVMFRQFFKDKLKQIERK